MPVHNPIEQSPTPPKQVSIQPLAQLARAPHWTFDLFHSCPNHRLLWITRGQGKITFDGQNFAYGPNSVIFTPAGVMHRFDLKPSVFGTILEVQDLPELEMPDQAVHLRVRDAMEQAKFVALVENLQKEVNSKAPFADRACLYHVGLIGVWLDRASVGQADGQSKNASRELVRKYMQNVESDFATGKIIQDYAEELGVTTTHLTRCCRNCLGQSALSLLNQRILQEARNLLIRTTLSGKDIARMLGFSSAAYFTRAFQHEVGVSPKTFRNNSKS